LIVYRGALTQLIVWEYIDSYFVYARKFDVEII